MIYVRFSDGVVNDPALRGRVKEIVDACSRGNLVGEDLWTTLVYSGVALGVESSQKYILGQVRDGATAFRTTLDELDRLILLLSDEDAISKVKSLREVIQIGLKTRVDAATSMQASESSKLFGISEEVLLADTDPREIPNHELQKIGFRASEMQKPYYTAWMKLRRVGALSDLKCRCHACVGAKLPRDEPIDVFAESAAMIDSLGGDYGSGLEEFAISVIEDQRRTLQAIIELRDPHEVESTTPADELMKNVMDSLKLGGKPGATKP